MPPVGADSVNEASAEPDADEPEKKCCAKKKKRTCCGGCDHTCSCNGRTPTPKKGVGQRGRGSTTLAREEGGLTAPNPSSKYVDRANSDASEDEEMASRLAPDATRVVELMSKAQKKSVSVLNWRGRTCRREWSEVIYPVMSILARQCGSSVGELLNKMYKEVPGARSHLASRDKEEELAQSIGYAVIDAMRVAPSQKLRDELLPLVVSADGSNLDALKSIFPWLTKWHYWQARKRTATGSDGSTEGVVKRHNVKLSQEKLETIVMFCLRADNVQDVAFGVNEYKLDSGDSFVVPDFIRMQVRKRLFDKFEEENGQGYISLSSFYKVANLICKRDLSSFAGLDNIDVDGKRAIDGLLEFIEEAKQKYSEHWTATMTSQYEQVKSGLSDSKQCLRQHLVDSVKDRCVHATHCINYSLFSDTMNDTHRCDHEHVNCAICDKFILSVSFCENLLGKLVAAPDIDTQEKEMYKTEVEGFIEDALSWMAHIVRSCVQGKVRPTIFGTLKENQCYIIIDWAMKWVSRYYREKMEEWYGKAGMHWHEAVVFYKDGSNDDGGGDDDDGNMQKMSITHIAEESKQNADQVFYLIADIMRKAKEAVPHLTEAYLQSDRAGCYHCKENIIRLAVADLPLAIVEINFSESQDGKDDCDRNIAVKKGAVMKYVRRGGNATTAPELISAIKSETVLTGKHYCIGFKPYDSKAHASLKMRSTQAIAKFSKYSQITFIRGNDGKVQSLDVRWQYNIGPPKRIPIGQFVLPDNVPNEIPIELERVSDDEIGAPTRAPPQNKRSYQKKAPPKKSQADLMKEISSLDAAAQDQDVPAEAAQPQQDQDESTGPPYVCVLCDRSYFKKGFFDRHMAAGKHTPPATHKSIKDRTGAILQAQLGEMVTLSSSHVRRKRSVDDISGASAEEPAPVRRKEGWARKADRKSHVRFSERVKAFIRKLFYDGIDENGKTDQAKKISPEKARLLLKEKVRADSWDPETELLTESQISSLFSREKQLMQKQCWEALQNSRVRDDRDQVQNSLMAREQVAAAVAQENPTEIVVVENEEEGQQNNN